jgi:predicted RNA-binding Zn-ribbon protein involved in translation (DUF1610 family)
MANDERPSLTFGAAVNAQQQSGSIAFACPKCGIGMAMTLEHAEPTKPACVKCGWSAKFSFTVTF